MTTTKCTHTAGRCDHLVCPREEARRERPHTPGVIQVHGGACLDHWHCAAPDQTDHGCDAHGATGSTCPTCGAIMMPGGAVTPEYAAEYVRRLEAQQCIATRGGWFVHVHPVPASKRALAGGACLCARHDR